MSVIPDYFNIVIQYKLIVIGSCLNITVVSYLEELVVTRDLSLGHVESQASLSCHFKTESIRNYACASYQISAYILDASLTGSSDILIIV